MTSFEPNIDATFLAYAELQLRRHVLLMDVGESEVECEDIEESMDRLWEKLDDAKRRSVNGMASDLNWIRRRGAAPPRNSTSENATLDDWNLLLDAFPLQHWHQVLHYLRVFSSRIPSARLAFLRGMVYRSLGMEDYARSFFEFAMNLNRADEVANAAASPCFNEIDLAQLFPATNPIRSESAVKSA